jgi:hypothetical protein
VAGDIVPHLHDQFEDLLVGFRLSHLGLLIGFYPPGGRVIVGTTSIVPEPLDRIAISSTAAAGRVPSS